jgi:hypothetical protein
MSTYSAIDTLQAIVDGDTIVPRMGFSLPSGVGTTQYYNPSTKVCTPSYTDSSKQILLYPSCYSSNLGKIIVPTSGKWYYNNPDSEEAAITDDDGNVRDKFKAYFQSKDNNGLLTYVVNGQTFPALKIIGNLAGENHPINSYNQDIAIYYKGTFNEVAATCHGDIAIRETVGDVYEVLLNAVNEGGDSDTVIDSDSEYIKITAQLLLNGTQISNENITWAWKKVARSNSGFETVTTVDGVSKLSDNNSVLTVYDAAVEGTEEFFAVATYNGNTYQKGIEICDTHDPYYIDVTRSTASNLIRETETVTYKPIVRKRTGEAVNQSEWSLGYALLHGQDKLSDGNVDSNGSFSVEGKLVKEYGEITVYIEASLNS